MYITDDLRRPRPVREPSSSARSRASRWSSSSRRTASLVGPLLAYLDVLDLAWPPDKEAPITFVVIPEYVARSWWERILYNQSAKRLRTVLLGRPHTVVVDVPYRREETALFEAALGGERRTARGQGPRPPADRRSTRAAGLTADDRMPRPNHEAVEPGSVPVVS